MKMESPSFIEDMILLIMLLKAKMALVGMPVLVRMILVVSPIEVAKKARKSKELPSITKIFLLFCMVYSPFSMAEAESRM